MKITIFTCFPEYFNGTFCSLLGKARDKGMLDIKIVDIKKYGVIVSSGVKRGLVLPDIEGINSVDEQIEIAKRKASILDDEIFL